MHFVLISELATSNHLPPTHTHKRIDLLVENFTEISAVFQTANVSFLNSIEERTLKTTYRRKHKLQLCTHFPFPNHCHLKEFRRIQNQNKMHSSRMRTVRSSGRISRGGVSAPGGCLLPGGVCSQGGCLLPWGVSAPGVSAPGGCGNPASTEADTPSPLCTDRRL